MTRRPIAFAAVALVAGVIALDAATRAPLNPYAAPPLIALGSGLAAGGAHCSALPSD